MSTIGLDRLVRKEVALGVLREFQPPQNHMGLSLAPFQDVESDDVIFAYTRGLAAGMAPARAEDAESEMAGKDDSVGTGRASLIDWALKDHYDPSDISRYNEALLISQSQLTNLPLTVGRITDGFQDRLARDTARRRRMLDNRIEWMIMQAMDLGTITYNDGKIQFVVDFGRPAAQQNMAPPGGLWSLTTSDPIGDILSVQANAFDTYGIVLDRAIISRKIMRNLRNSDKFTNLLLGSNPLYTVAGWGDAEAQAAIERQTSMTFIEYDSVYRTRPLGSNVMTNNRFTRDTSVIFLPSTSTVDELDDAIGFGKTLTSPHPEGNWQSGFYEWERSTVDPWGYDVGTGVKAFPVFPHLDLTYVMTVL